MKEQWQQLARKYDALAPRERIIMLVAMIAAISVFFYYLALDPLSAQKRRLTLDISAKRTAITAAENVLKLGSRADPNAAKRAHRDALRKQIEELDRNMQGMQRELVPPEQMAKLLDGMLARDRGLQLLALRKLPVQRFETPGTALKANTPGAAQPERGIYQHSFELIIQGSYVDLHDYLARLEKLPWHMFWGKISMDAANYPKLKVTLTVHTLSVNKAWLIV